MDAAEDEERAGLGKSISTVSPGSCAPESKSSAGSKMRTLWVRVSLLTIHSRSPRWSATWSGWNVLSSCDTVLTCAAGALGPLCGHDLFRQRGRTVAGQRAEERDEVGALGVRQRPAAGQVLRQRRPLDHAVLVVAQHVVERRQRAVMHVGRGAADLAQSRRLERVLRGLQPQHRAAAAIVAGQADVVEGMVGEGKAAVAFRAAGLAGEQAKARDLAFGQRGLSPSIHRSKRVLGDTKVRS